MMFINIVVVLLVYAEVEKRIHLFRETLYRKLLKLPNTLEEQKKTIR